MQALLRPFRWLLGKTSRRKEIILRHNIAGLEILVVSHCGRVVSNTIEIETMQGNATDGGTAELLYFNMDVERFVESEPERE